MNRILGDKRDRGYPRVAWVEGVCSSEGLVTAPGVSTYRFCSTYRPPFGDKREGVYTPKTCFFYDIFENVFPQKLIFLPPNGLFLRPQPLSPRPEVFFPSGKVPYLIIFMGLRLFFVFWPEIWYGKKCQKNKTSIFLSRSAPI